MATHLSVVRAQAPDPALVSRLTSLVARARSQVTGASAPAWRMSRFLGGVVPRSRVAVRWWVIGVAGSFLLVAISLGWWIAAHPHVQTSIASSEQIRQPSTTTSGTTTRRTLGDFAFQVWTNNAWIAALCITLGGFLGLR